MPRLSDCELEIDLFCKGLRIGEACALVEDGRVIARTRAGLGSGLELVIPGKRKDIWMNAPVEEDFAQSSPYYLLPAATGYCIEDSRNNERYTVRIPHEPEWCGKKTTGGTVMSQVCVLQGTYLGVYLSNSCSFWFHNPSVGCKFCTTGLNVGVNEVIQKDVDEVVEVAQAAKDESGVTFIHFNSGFDGKDRGLDMVAPYVKAIKERVGLLTGVQVTPTPNLWKYDWLVDCGTDHFSFCYEFHNPKFFGDLCPGKEQKLGQKTFFNAIEYTAKKMGKGKVSGEIIAGVEPIQDTLDAIDYITGAGAFPTVCIFRPTLGADMEHYPPPKYEEMRQVMAHMWEACRRNKIPIAMAPNIEVSLIVNPDDARDLVPNSLSVTAYDLMLKTLKLGAKPIIKKELSPHPVSGDPGSYPPGSPELLKAMSPEALEFARRELQA